MQNPSSVKIDAPHVLRILKMFGWRQHKLAREAGISENTLSRALNDNYISRETAIAIGRAIFEELPEDIIIEVE